MHQSLAPEQNQQSVRVRVIGISIVAGVFILALKWLAFLKTGSSALKSDAIESVVNVVAAVFALGSVVFAGIPADRNHPYGHGKIEHFSAAFEGGLVALAAVFIWVEAIQVFIHGSELRSLNIGLLLNLGAGSLNGLLGLYLIRQGRKTQSKALEADGHHVMSDFLTTLGVALGLLAVKLTGWTWIDPALALMVGCILAVTGFKLVRHAAMGLLDEEDPVVLGRLVELIRTRKPADVIAIHELRTMRTGRFTHADVHVVVPEFYPVGRAHDMVERFGLEVLRSSGIAGEFHSHVDPCRRMYCARCEIKDCPVRTEAFMKAIPLTLEEATSTGPAEELE